jgi:transposase
MSKGKQNKKKLVNLNSLEQINLNAAGLDIGAEEIWGCVPENRTKENVHQFGTFTRDLHNIADWLERCQVTAVAMEATGVYWIPIYEILEARGFEADWLTNLI